MARLMQILRPGVCAAVCMLLAAAACCRAGDEPADEAHVRYLIRELDHPEFSHRASATRELLEIGEEALGPLLEAAQSDSPEVRHRARGIVTIVVDFALKREFADLGAAKTDKEVDVERGMWLISRLVDPLVKKRDLDERLDALAARVRERIEEKHGPNVNPAEVPPEDAVAAIRRVLFVEEGFTGNRADYSNPQNSSLHHVLKSHKGLPILLSHVVVAVARRVEIPIVGLGVPGRYMCMYDGSRAPGGPVENIIIDPFGDGRIVTIQQLGRELPGYTIPDEPDGNRSALTRMLNNAISHFTAAGDDRAAFNAATFQQLLNPPEPMLFDGAGAVF